MNFDELTARLLELQQSGVWLGPVTSLMASFVFGQVLAWTYERTYHGLSYSRGFSHTLVLVTISSSILVLSMQYSILAGLGLFGVLSMIRFRADLKTPRDLVFVMGCACVGVASGVGALMISAFGSIAFSFAAIYLAAGPFGARMRFDGVLRFRIEASGDLAPLAQQLINAHCRKRVLLSSTDMEDGRVTEHVYQVKFFRESDRDALMNALRADIGAQGTRLLLQDSTSEY
ncbi:MAG: hypothetical protein ACI8TX_000833 [Hyphomicrobiaceae bacterium]|jgi:hypothetical protein